MKKYESGGPGGPSDTRYVMNKYKKDGTSKKHKEISKKRFDRVSKRYDKQKGSKSLGTSTSPGQQVISGRNPRNSVSRADKSRMKRPRMSKGGSLKEIPASNKGLPMLSTPVRNQMGFKKTGGAALTSAMNGYEMKRGGSCGKVYKKGSFRRKK